MISASRTPTTTPSPIDAALPVICACVWIVPPPSSAGSDVRVRVALAAGLLGLDAHQRAMGRGVLLDDLDRAGNFIDIAPIRIMISAFTDVAARRLEHAAALDGGHDALEVGDRREALVDRLLGREG